MSNWSKNNWAFYSTYLSLRILEDLPKGFESSEKIKLKTLNYWVDVSSPELREERAKALSKRLDRMFRYYPPKAKMEKNQTSYKARKEITALLLSPGKTVGDLGLLVDKLYLFTNE